MLFVLPFSSEPRFDVVTRCWNAGASGRFLRQPDPTMNIR
jgi:hypothetical protein